MKPVVLTFVRRYLPGYKSGGPVRTIANMVEHLGGDFEFLIVTLDRDAHDVTPYPAITAGTWSPVGNARVCYLRQDELRLTGVMRLLRETRHDVLYLNSFFDPAFTGLPLLARHLGADAAPVVLAPRGEFSEGALALKAWKKKPYIAAARLVRFYGNLTWQASSAFEGDDIARVMGAQARTVVIAPNLPPATPPDAALLPSRRRPGVPLRVLFLSRITPKKNLDFALRILARVRATVQFTIAGPVADESYWQRCQALIRALPSNVEASVRGSVEPDAIPGLMAAHDLFLLPTRGENYGHVIAEALSAGTPVLIADTTPWRGLREAGVGWDLDLRTEAAYTEAVESAVQKNSDEYAAWRRRVQEYARVRLQEPSAVQANRRLFLSACGHGADSAAEVGWNVDR